MKPGEKIRPLHDLVLVVVIAKPGRTASGLILPTENSRGREDMAQVVAVGPGRVLDDGTLVPVDVKPGDVVSFDPYAVKLVLDKNGEMDMTNSAYARGGDQAIIPESAIRYVVT